MENAAKIIKKLQSIDIFAIAICVPIFSNLVFWHFSINYFAVLLNDN